MPPKRRNASMTVCMTSSLDGTTIKIWSMRLATKSMLSTVGMRYARVFPEPVCAWITTSRFLKKASDARRWIAVGYLYPRDSARSQSHSAMPIARQSRISAAGESPTPWSSFNRALSFAARPKSSTAMARESAVVSTFSSAEESSVCTSCSLSPRPSVGGSGIDGSHAASSSSSSADRATTPRRDEDRIDARQTFGRRFDAVGCALGARRRERPAETRATGANPTLLIDVAAIDVIAEKLTAGCLAARCGASRAATVGRGLT